MDLHANLIDGEWVEGEAIPNVNPANTGEVVGHYARASAEDAGRAIAAAKAAFPGWSRSGPLERHGVLSKAAAEILARKEELGRLLAREEGKTLAEGIGETVRAAQIFDFFAGECLRLTGEILPSVRPGLGVEITREAVGPVGLITPWNFPIAIPAWKLAPALAWGNTVVIKPADLVPGCTWALVDILNRAGLPKGVLNLVMGKGSVVGQAILDSAGHPRGQLHRLGRHRAAGGRGERAGDAQVPAGDGRQEPDGGARRRRPRGGGRRLPERGVLLDRTALHRELAADRAGRHPRPLRQAAEGADGGAGGRRPARQGDADRPRRRCGPARAGRELHRDRPRRGRRARRRRAAEARHARASSWRRRSSSGRPTPCGSAARRSSARSPG